MHASYAPGSAWAAPAALPDGTRAVLKVTFPDSESEHEAAASEWWAGDGAVRLFAHDVWRRALLIERCEPGEPLWAMCDERATDRIAAGVLARVLKPTAHQASFAKLGDEAAQWAESLPLKARQNRPRHSTRERWLRRPGPASTAAASAALQLPWPALWPWQKTSSAPWPAAPCSTRARATARRGACSGRAGRPAHTHRRPARRWCRRSGRPRPSGG